jgi:hypothetical protein
VVTLSPSQRVIEAAETAAHAIAILLNCAVGNVPSDAALERVLVPTTAADHSRFGAEVAVAIAKGCGAMITALNISAPPAENELLRRPNQSYSSPDALSLQGSSLSASGKVSA